MQTVKTYWITNAEITAFQLLNKGKPFDTRTSSYEYYRKAGNEIIELAERIKAERLNCLIESQPARALPVNYEKVANRI